MTAPIVAEKGLAYSRGLRSCFPAEPAPSPRQFRQVVVSWQRPLGPLSTERPSYVLIPQKVILTTELDLLIVSSGLRRLKG